MSVQSFSSSSSSRRPIFGGNTTPVHPSCILVHIPSTKIGELAEMFRTSSIAPSAVLMDHNSLGFTYEDRTTDYKGRQPMHKPTWILKTHVETHTTMALAYAHTTNEGIPCENCHTRFNINSGTYRAMCSVHVCNRCHNGFWCSKQCYEDTICLHGIRCHDSPAFSMSEYTSNSLWPQYQALGATIGPSTSQQTHAPHPAAQPTMGPPATVPRPDAGAITTWPTQPGLEHGIQCPSTGWTTTPPEGKYGQPTYSHPQVHNGMRFEYHRIRGAYIIHNVRDATKRLSYGTSFKLFLATTAELEAESFRIQTAKKHRKAKDPTA